LIKKYDPNGFSKMYLKPILVLKPVVLNVKTRWYTKDQYKNGNLNDLFKCKVFLKIEH